MRILVLTPTFLPIIGGAELGIYEIYQRLGKYHDVRILTPNIPDYLIAQRGAKDTYFTVTNFEVRHFNDRFNLTKSKAQGLLKGLLPPFSISYVWAVFKQIRTFHPDIINLHYTIPGGLALMLVRMLTKIPAVLSLIGRTDVLGNETPFFRKHYLWKVVKSSSYVISISKYNVRWPPASKLGHIIPYGVDTELFSPKANGAEIRKNLGIGKTKVVLFALQRLVKVKRIDILIESLKYIQKANREIVLVIGGKGPEELSLKNLAKELKVEDHIIFAGYIPEKELPKYFAMADIFTFHSTYETFGIVLAQAMACGKPIVSVNSTAIPEVVDNGLNGILVEPLDPKQFAAGVINLINDRELRQRYSQNSRKKAVEKYSWEVIAAQYDRVFKDLVQG